MRTRSYGKIRKLAMRKMMLTVVLIMCFTSVVQAQTFVKDPFTDGNLTDPDWTVAGTVVDDPLDAGNPVLKVPSTPEGRTHGGMTDSVTQSVYTPLDLSVRFNLDHTGDRYANFAWSLRTTVGAVDGYHRNSSGYGFKASSDKKSFSLIRYTKDGGGAGHVSEAAIASVTLPTEAVQPGWNTARLIWGSGGALALSINGELVLTATDTTHPLALAQVAYYGFVNNTAGDDGKYMLFDDLRVAAARQQEPAYTHPRVLIGPGDLPELRDRLENSAVGRRTIAAIRGWVDSALFADNAPLAEAYQALIDEDASELSNFPTGFWRSNLSLTLQLRAFDCLVRDDAACGADVGAAITAYAKIAGGDLVVPGLALTTDIQIGYAYDYAYNYMTNTQRQVVREAISDVTYGQTLYGTNLAPELRDNNVVVHSTSKTLLALAIEGETGYDPNLLVQAEETMRDYFKYGLFDSGAATEDMHYLNFGMDHGAATLAALGKRGIFLYDQPKYRALKNWYIHSIEPFGYKFSTLGDTPDDSGGLMPNYALMKWLFPDDAEIDFIWRNRVRDDYTGIKARQDFHMVALFGRDYEGGDDTEASPDIDQWGTDNTNGLPIVLMGPWNAPDLLLPKSFSDWQRGLFITRTDWSRAALALTFETNSFNYGPSHTHSNVNDFTFSALGQKWAVDRGYHIMEGQNHSTVVIDGRGQGFFGPGGATVGHLDSTLATAAIGDAKYAYDYRWTFKGRRNNDENSGYTWEFEPLSKRPETDTNSTFRAAENPVSYAFRSATLVRGVHPYALILDDIRKDGSEEHVYDWLMQVPKELEAKSVKGGDLVLGLDEEAENSPRLLVRSLFAASTTNLVQRDSYMPIRLETFEIRNSPKTGSYQNEAFGMGKRVAISSRSVSPDFKTLLFPFAPETPLPVTTWVQPGEKLKVEWPDQKDDYVFEKRSDGRTAYGMLRNDGEAFLSAGLREYNPISAISVTASGEGPQVAMDADGMLTVAGSGWGTLTITAPGIVSVVSDGSVGSIATTSGGVVLTEA